MNRRNRCLDLFAGLVSQGLTNRWVYPLCLFVLTVVSRTPFTSKLLYDQDAVQFALGIEKYDVYLHQPHPPGYFLYVMAGRVINIILHDANLSFLVLSVVASGLTVVAVYQLAVAIFDRETALWAAAMAFTSPLLWYYGEVALTYVVAAFFNTWIAILCWDLLWKRSRWLYLSSIVLGITGGIRQDVLIFLVPLWLFCVLQFKWEQVLTVVVLLGLTVTSWFVPMLLITGGPERYYSAVREYWLFHTSTFAVWNAGIASRGFFFLAFLGNIAYGIGLGTIFLIFGFYAFSRTGYWRLVSKKKILFFILWLLPAFLFHIFVFMNPGQAGYAVFFLPALFVLLLPAVKYVLAEIRGVLGWHTFGAAISYNTIVLGLITANILFYLFSDSVVSAKGIREHDHNLGAILRGIERNFPPSETVIVDDRFYGLYNYRHVQYYLRKYHVYLIALSKERGVGWHVFGAKDGQTLIGETMEISNDARYVVYLTNPLDHNYIEALEVKGFRRLQLDERNVLLYQLRR